MRSRKRKASTARWILFGMRWRHGRTSSRLCFHLLTDKVLHPQYRGLIADSRWPYAPHPSSRCSSSIWRAKLWIPPPSSTWWWKTTRLLGKISKCNTAEPGVTLTSGIRLPNVRLVWTRRREWLFDRAAAPPGAAVAHGWSYHLHQCQHVNLEKSFDCVTAICTSWWQPPTGLATHHHRECTGKQ